MAALTYEHYYLPETIEDALAQLAQHHGRARIIAGGTDLMIDMQYGAQTAAGEPHPIALVDVTRIPEMNSITTEGEQVIVGASVSHARIVKTLMLEQRATCLVESCGVVGGPQVRNVATLGGNVAHALPAADGTTALVALDAEVLVAWADGRRIWHPIAELFRGAGESLLNPRRDVLVKFRFNLAGEGEGSASKRVMRPQGVALPVLACSVWVRLNAARDAIEEARVCLSPVAPTPVRASAVEDALRGQSLDSDLLAPAIKAAHETLHPRTSKYRATGEYRNYMIESLLGAALPMAIRRARTGEATAEGVGM